MLTSITQRSVASSLSGAGRGSAQSGCKDSEAHALTSTKQHANGLLHHQIYYYFSAILRKHLNYDLRNLDICTLGEDLYGSYILEGAGHESP